MLLDEVESRELNKFNEALKVKLGLMQNLVMFKMKQYATN